jgi:hypothetical protein
MIPDDVELRAHAEVIRKVEFSAAAGTISAGPIR